jgi:Hexokinase
LNRTFAYRPMGGPKAILYGGDDDSLSELYWYDCRFEKMISGMYMGEIVRLVLCELTLRGLIFRRRDSDQLFEQQRFFTKYISEIER